MMTETIEHGTAGLVYLTDSQNRSIFIAAHSDQEARELAAQARIAVPEGKSVLHHVTHDHTTGNRLTVPTPEWMTPEQRNETIVRLKEHLQRINS